MKNSSNDYFDYLGEIVDGLLAEDKEQTNFSEMLKIKLNQEKNSSRCCDYERLSNHG